MNAFVELGQAAIGWLDLIAGRPGGVERFKMTRRGLINAVGFYVAVVLIAMVLAGGLSATADQQIFLMLGNLAPALLLGVIGWATMKLLRPAEAALSLAVPTIYALGFMLVVRLVLALFAGPAVMNAVLGALGFMLYRAGRQAGGLNVGMALVFAVLCVLALVVMTAGLYMLVSEGPTG
ncbi:hypothetical protein [Devosia sp.]|uniref:hypothetical protein n=1 Tax=Devosia sp. TaxID=1871048 RepID=UPI003A947D44